jgi:hypothetical protein
MCRTPGAIFAVVLSSLAVLLTEADEVGLHQGCADPTTEGWVLSNELPPVGGELPAVKPVEDRCIGAWAIAGTTFVNDGHS